MSDERIAPKEMRIPLRDAVKQVLGPKGSAIVGDDLAAALCDAGFELYKPNRYRPIWWCFEDDLPGEQENCDPWDGHELCREVRLIPGESP